MEHYLHYILLIILAWLPDKYIPEGQNLFIGEDKLHIQLDVKPLLDEKFEGLNKRDYISILNFAKRTIEERIPEISISYKILPEENVQEYFYKIYEKDYWKRCHSCYYFSKEETQIFSFSEKGNSFRKLKAEDLKNLGLDKKDLYELENDYDDQIKKYILEPYKNTFLLTDVPQARYSNWGKLLRLTTDADIYITNTFIVADNMEEIHPHVLPKGKIGGMALDSNFRRNINYKSSLITTFGNLELVKLLEKGKKFESLPREKRLELLGVVLLTHELFHMLFNLPDYHDHPEYCILNTNQKTLDYIYHYEILQRKKEICPICLPSIYFEIELMKAQVYYNRGEFEKAIQIINGLIELSHKIDKANYLEYLNGFLEKIFEKKNAKLFERIKYSLVALFINVFI